MQGLGTTEIKLPPGQLIQLEFCERYGITLAEMRGECRKRRFAHPRQEAMVAVRQRLGYSYPKIARLFGGRHHTTILYACRKAGLPVDLSQSEASKRGAMKRAALAALVAAAL